MSTGKRSIRLLVALLFFYLAAHAAFAQTQAAASVDADRIAKLEAAVADAKGSADNSWMLTSSALVLLMTGPGLALFYRGVVWREKLPAPLLHSTSHLCPV